jgi:hypothetical protein
MFIVSFLSGCIGAIFHNSKRNVLLAEADLERARTERMKTEELQRR